MPLTQNDDVAAVALQLGPQIRAAREEREELRQRLPRSLMPSLRLVSTRCICRARPVDLR